MKLGMRLAAILVLALSATTAVAGDDSYGDDSKQAQPSDTTSDSDSVRSMGTGSSVGTDEQGVEQNEAGPKTDNAESDNGESGG